MCVCAHPSKDTSHQLNKYYAPRTARGGHGQVHYFNICFLFFQLCSIFQHEWASIQKMNECIWPFKRWHVWNLKNWNLATYLRNALHWWNANQILRCTLVKTKRNPSETNHIFHSQRLTEICFIIHILCTTNRSCNISPLLLCTMNIFFPRTGALSFQTNLHQLELGNDDDDENQHRNDDDDDEWRSFISGGSFLQFTLLFARFYLPSFSNLFSQASFDLNAAAKMMIKWNR